MSKSWQAAHHDLVLAITSHVPHLIAYNIVGTAADLEEVTQSEVIKFSAGGFRDFTRIAASDPTMWRDVFLNNKEAVLEMLGRFNEDLSCASAHDPPRRRRGPVRAFHPHEGDPARHHRSRPGNGRARLRPPGARRLRSRPKSDAGLGRFAAAVVQWTQICFDNNRKFRRTQNDPAAKIPTTGSSWLRLFLRITLPSADF